MAAAGPPVLRTAVNRATDKTPRQIGRWAAVALGIAVLLLVPRPAAADDLQQAATELAAKYAGEIRELAAWCDQRQLPEQAAETRRCLGRQDPDKLHLPLLPEEVGQATPPADAPADLLQWDRRLRQLRRDQGDGFFELAQRAVKGRRFGLAFDLAMAAVHANPDHEAVRQLLGYQQYAGQWHTTFEVRRLRVGQVWHPEFGWILKSHVARYEQGERYYRGRWISAEQDAKLHADIDSPWLVETDHYAIRSDHSLETAAQLGAKLERLHYVWRQLFVRYYASEAEVLAWFNGRGQAQPTQGTKLNVTYFRDRQEYERRVKAMVPNMPSIELSIGFYYSTTQTAYFFAGDDYEDRTVYHEATHQLFHQSRPVARDVGKRANFWIVEGIALYMESLAEDDGYCVLGGWGDPRMVAARYRLLNDGFYVPLAELTAFGMDRLQGDPKIATLYSQAAGLTNFLIHYDGGRYRDALVAYLSEVYDGRDRPDSLARLSGVSFQDLDQQYRRFMESGPGAAGGG